MGAAEIKGYLEYLAQERDISASTQNQALNALVFLYTQVLKADFGYFSDFMRAKKRPKLPVVLTKKEIQQLFGQLSGIERAALRRGTAADGMHSAADQGCRFGGTPDHPASSAKHCSESPACDNPLIKLS